MSDRTPPGSSAARILDLIDAGLQSSTEAGYGTDRRPNACARCQDAPPAEDGDLCAGCRAFLLEDTDLDPAAAAPAHNPFRELVLDANGQPVGLLVTRSMLNDAAASPPARRVLAAIDQSIAFVGCTLDEPADIDGRVTTLPENADPAIHVVLGCSFTEMSEAMAQASGALRAAGVSVADLLAEATDDDDPVDDEATYYVVAYTYADVELWRTEQRIERRRVVAVVGDRGAEALHAHRPSPGDVAVTPTRRPGRRPTDHRHVDRNIALLRRIDRDDVLTWRR